MSLKYGLLGLLNYYSMTGYELCAVFREDLDFFWQAQISQVYRELDAMEKDGWVISNQVIQNGKPNRRVFTITENGATELSDWLSAPDTDIAAAMKIKSAFLLRIFLAGESDEELAAQNIIDFRDKSAERLRSLSDAANTSSNREDSAKKLEKLALSVGDQERTRYWKLITLYEECFLRANIEWAEKAIQIIDNR